MDDGKPGHSVQFQGLKGAAYLSKEGRWSVRCDLDNSLKKVKPENLIRLHVETKQKNDNKKKQKKNKTVEGTGKGISGRGNGRGSGRGRGRGRAVGRQGGRRSQRE